MKKFLQVLTVLMVLGAMTQTIVIAKDNDNSSTSAGGGEGSVGSHDPGV